MEFQNKDLILDPEELEKIFTRVDRMDIFVHFLSYISRVGFDVPLSSVHWVLAANRLIKLGERVSSSPEKSIRRLLGMRKIGLPISAYNSVNDLSETIQSTKVLKEIRACHKALSEELH